MTDIYKCTICKVHVLAEETDSHVCKRGKDIKFEDDKLLVSDGENWYPLKLEKIPMSRFTRILSCPEDFDSFKKRNA